MDLGLARLSAPVLRAASYALLVLALPSAASAQYRPEPLLRARGVQELQLAARSPVTADTLRTALSDSALGIGSYREHIEGGLLVASLIAGLVAAKAYHDGDELTGAITFAGVFIPSALVGAFAGIVVHDIRLELARARTTRSRETRPAPRSRD